MIKPTQKFKYDFNLVLNHYQVDVDEAKFEKARVMANYHDAALCYAAIAEEIKMGLIDNAHTKDINDTNG